MKCGSKHFLFEIEINGESKFKQIAERTPACARKEIRKEYGEYVEILSVREQN